MTLSGCSEFDRSYDASAARRRMIGLTKEDVLACMGPPGKKATVGSTEVWSYYSTNGLHNGNSLSTKIYGSWLGDSSGKRSFCYVNVVMTNDVVKTVHYNGPRGGMMDRDEQCGYAVEHCARND